jgi:hypothetical protein
MVSFLPGSVYDMDTAGGNLVKGGGENREDLFLERRSPKRILDILVRGKARRNAKGQLDYVP